MLEWVTKNKEWFLEGLGVFILSVSITFIVWLIKRNKTSSDGNYSQSMGNNVKGRQISFTKNRQTINSSETKEEN